jgi:pimeloyl-ACP methyl ester carboxylesterase
MPSVILNGGSVFYREQGHGPAVLMLHANPGDSRDFDAIAPSLAKQYRVLALDWPGYGRSPFLGDTRNASATLFYAVLKDFVAALGLRQVVLIGNSVGGNAAARFAIEFPEKVLGLILVAPGGFTDHNFLTRLFCQLQGSRLALSPHIWARTYLKRRTKTSLEMIDRASDIQATTLCKRVNQAIWRSFLQPDHDLRLKSVYIKAPTLLLFGKFDVAIPARKDGAVANRCIPGAKLVVLPCGHAPFAEMPEAFLGAVLPFCQIAAGGKLIVVA